jgi:Cft2 family RNA processing exonuclease
MKHDVFLPLGGGNEIGASSYLLRIDGVNILIDAGIRLKSKRVFPDFSLLNQMIGGFKELDAVLLTHAHLDHCGAITKIHYEAPLVPIFTSTPTSRLIQVMLNDALKVNHRKSEDWSIVDPSKEVLDDTISSLNEITLDRPFFLDSSDVQVFPKRAGHILGAMSFLLETRQKRILVTGDICLHDQRTIGGCDLSNIGNIDVLIIESTYAFQPDQEIKTFDEQQYALVHQISKIVQNGGRVLIPSFALGRAQEIACLLGEYFEQGIIAPFPVLIDGLVKPVCDIYHEMKEYLQGRLRTRLHHSIYTDHIIPVPEDYYPTRSSINQLSPGCIISSSGMLVDNTRSAKYAESIIENIKDAILFSGYLDDESPGRRLLELNDNPSSLVINNRLFKPEAMIDRYHLSAHAPSFDLIKIILSINPRKIIMVHGNFKYKSDPSFTKLLFGLEEKGIHVYQAANGVPIYL